MLIIFGGLPGSGKTTIARELARQLGSVHLRIDTIEQAIRNCAAGVGGLDEAGYQVAYGVAEDNLRIGRSVIADSVNPIAITREAWRGVGLRCGVKTIEVEITCSDAVEHRRRVEGRTSDIAGLRVPSWGEVVAREYHPWDREHVVIDTAGVTVEESVRVLTSRIAAMRLEKGTKE
jgi:predicted kinase